MTLDPFAGRTFPRTPDGWQCDRCSRTYPSIVHAAECDGPNHSQIVGWVKRTPPPPPKRTRSGKYASAEEAEDARMARHREYSRRRYQAKAAAEGRTITPKAKLTDEERIERRRESQRRYWARKRERLGKPPREKLDAEEVAARKRERSRQWRAQNPDKRRAQQHREYERRRAQALRGNSGHHDFRHDSPSP